MNDAPRQTLRELIARHGPGLCSDARRCEGLLRDLCGEHRREINILVGALRDRVPLDLLASKNSVPRDLLLARLAKRMEDNLALTEAASRWAVDSWALALGIVSEADLEEVRSRRVATAPPEDEASPPPVPTPPRPTPETEVRPGKPAAPAVTRPPVLAPPVAPPRARQSPVPPSAHTTPRGSSPPAVRTQTGATHAPPAAPTRGANTGGLQSPSAGADARGARGRWRGCLVGCLVVVLLSALLALGGPFVINILREEQEQRNREPTPVQTR